ncbi:MAG: TRAP transporter small permease, partial [Rhodospirillales bacterium]|nr:TRAP transporter small permease [Rhodospirillales bacterium]
MRKFDKLVAGPANILVFLACVLTVLMMLHVTAEVATKYIFAYQFEGTIEIVSSYNMVAIVFFPLAYVARNEGHIVVELFTRSMPARAVTKLDAAMGVITFVFMVIFTWITAEEAIARTIDGEVVQTAADVLIIWPSRWFLPAGGAVMAAYVLIRLIDDFRGVSS